MCMYILVACVVLSSLLPTPASAGQESEVIEFVKKYDIAWDQKDGAAIERMLAPNYVYFTSKGAVTQRQALLDELLSPNYTLTFAQRNEVNVYMTQGTAVVSSRWRGQGSFNGKDFHDDQRCSIVMVRGKQDWTVLSEHCTQISAP